MYLVHTPEQKNEYHTLFAISVCLVFRSFIPLVHCCMSAVGVKGGMNVQNDIIMHSCMLTLTLSHSAYITSHIIMPFRKAYHMPFTKLILPFCLFF